MLIGGIEVHLPTRAGSPSVELAVRAVQKRWPTAVCENGVTGERYEHVWQVPFGEIEELFIYRDEHTADAWDEQGAVPSTHNTMVHLVADADTLTVVVDERDAEMNALIAAVESSLKNEAVEHSNR